VQVMERHTEEVVLTPSGRRRIESELERLVTVERHDVAERIRDAKTFGDLSENAEYEAAKTAQAFVEGRILDLKWILANARTLNEDDVPTDRVGLGSLVTVRDLDYDDEWTLTLVSPFEADPDKDRISDQSPVGQALRGHAVGDTIDVKTPGGITRYQIVQIGK
jgi:transcription elongation factor GreA